MTRLWRAATLALVATTLVVGPTSAVFATTGDAGDRSDTPSDRVAHRPHDRVEVRVDGVVPDSPMDAEIDARPDHSADRARDRATDRAAERPTDRVTDRPTDRVSDRTQRPECDRANVSDRVHDCRPRDHFRPALARCMEYVQNHTDVVTKRSLRWWWHVCHRIAWDQTHPK